MGQKVSIVVPVYNAASYLDDCIKSVVDQAYKDWELLLINDGSKDNSEIICKQYSTTDGRIHYYKKQNGGAASARNEGLVHCTGDYVMFLDSDDALPEYAVENLLNIIQKERADIVSGHLISIVNHKKRWDEDHVFTDEVERYDSATAISKMFYRELDFSQCAKIYRRGIIGDLRFAEGRTNEDTLFLYNVYQKCNTIVYVDKGMYLYRENQASVSHSYKDHFFDIYYNMCLMEHEIECLPEKVRKAFYEYKLKVCLDFCYFSLKHKVWNNHPSECKDAKRYCIKKWGQIAFDKHFSWKYGVKYLWILGHLS